MKRYNLSAIMKKAWNIFRSTKLTFSEALKKSWAYAKESVLKEVRYQIADWFMNKNLDKVTSAHCYCCQTFGKSDILKETDKAMYVRLDMLTNSGFETRYTRNIWVPKSVVSEYLV